MLSAIMLFSGLIRGSFPVLLVSLCYYMICSGIPVVCEIVAQRMRESAGSIIYKFLQVMTAVFPDFSRLDFKDAVVSGLNPPQLTHTLTAFGVVVTYTVLALFLSGTVYKRRDLQ